MAEKDCVFCGIVSKKIPAKLVFESEDIIAFDDIKPQAPVHVLVVPKAHIDRISDLKSADNALVGEIVLAANEIARKRGVGSSGYRIVMNCNRDAGQEVFHIHAHLLGGRKFSWPPG